MNIARYDYTCEGDEFERAAHLNLWSQGDTEHNILEDTVDWEDLLRGTAWN